MTYFQVRYLSGRGATPQLVERDFYVNTAQQAREEVAALGGLTVSVRPGVHRPRWLQRGFSLRDRARLLRSLTFQSRDAPPGQALLRVIEAESGYGDPKKADIARRFAPAKDMLQGGYGFTEAMRALDIYDPAVLAILDAGERSGTLRQVITQALDLVNQRSKTVARMIKIATALSADLFTALSTVWGMEFQMLPWLEANVTPAEAEKAAAFKDSLAIAYGVNRSLFAAAVMVAVLFLWQIAAHWLQRSQEDHFAARILRKTPIIGKAILDSSLSDSFFILARLLKSNTPFSKSIRIVTPVAGLGVIRNFWREVCDRLDAGLQVAPAMDQPLISRAEHSLIAIHRDTQQLGEIIEDIGSERAASAQEAVTKLVTVGVYATIAYVIAIALNVVYVFMAQSDAISASMTMTGL